MMAMILEFQQKKFQSLAVNVDKATVQLFLFFKGSKDLEEVRKKKKRQPPEEEPSLAQAV